MVHHHHDCDACDDGPTSTGFLPLSLALTLFITGLFALGWVQCDPNDEGAATEAATPDVAW